MVQTTRIIGTGLAITGLIGAGVGIGVVFGVLIIVVGLLLVSKLSLLLAIAVILVIIAIKNSGKVKKYIQENKLTISAIIIIFAIGLMAKFLSNMFNVEGLNTMHMIFAFYISSLFLITRMMLKEKTLDRWFITKFVIYLMLPVLISYVFSYIEYSTGAITLIMYEISLLESLYKCWLYIGGGYSAYTNNQQGSTNPAGGSPNQPENNNSNIIEEPSDHDESYANDSLGSSVRRSIDRQSQNSLEESYTQPPIATTTSSSGHVSAPASSFERWKSQFLSKFRDDNLSFRGKNRLGHDIFYRPELRAVSPAQQVTEVRPEMVSSLNRGSDFSLPEFGRIYPAYDPNINVHHGSHGAGTFDLGGYGNIVLNHTSRIVRINIYIGNNNVETAANMRAALLHLLGTSPLRRIPREAFNTGLLGILDRLHPTPHYMSNTHVPLTPWLIGRITSNTIT